MKIPTEIIDRYWNMLSDIEPKQEDDPGTSIPHIKWMISELRKDKEIGKQNWLGFIQYALIINGYTSVTEERNFTRPFFTNDPNKHICTFCEKKIVGDPDYTEDGEMVHSECLEEYNKFWKDRGEFIDLIGF